MQRKSTQHKKKIHHKISLLLVAGLFLLSGLTSTIGALIPTSTASADAASDCAASGGKYVYQGSSMTCMPAGSTSDFGPRIDVTASADWTDQDEVMSSIYLRSLYACMGGGTSTGGVLGSSASGDWIISTTSALDFDKWDAKDIIHGANADSVLMDADDDGHLNCADEKGWLSNAFALWQINSKIDALCIFGFVRGGDVFAHKSGLGYDNCVGGEGDVLHSGYYDDDNTNFKPNVTAGGFLTRLQNARGITMTLDKPHTYLLYRYVFEKGGNTGNSCGASRLVKFSEANPDQKALIDAGEAAKVSIVEIPEGKDYKNAILNDYIYQYQDGSKNTTTTKISTYLSSYPLYTRASDGKKSPSADGKESCQFIAAAMNALVGDYLTAVLAGDIDNTAAAAQPGCVSANSCKNSNGSSCVVPSIGWIVCPLFEMLGGVLDGTYGLIEGFLATPKEILQRDNGTYNGWLVTQSIANIGLVIVFLFIIFSQLSSIGVSNYGVKKLLPRIIIAAILINGSFIVCQIAADLSNILGGSLKDILDNLPVFSGATASSLLGDTSNIFSQMVTGIITGQVVIGVGTAAVAIAIFTGVGLLIPILLGGLLAVAMTFLILIARQAIIVLLIVLAPLAFLAMLLPNTEQYFKQWRKMFVAMLLLYPMIALLFGGAHVASAILLQAFAGTTILGGTMFAQAVLVVPLIATPYLLKGSLNAIPIVGNLAAKLQSRANGVAGRGVKEFARSTPIARGWRAGKQRRAELRDEKFADSVMKGKGAGGVAGIFAGRKGSEALERQAFGATEDADTKNVNFQAALLARKARSGEFKDANGKARGFHDAVGDELEAAIKAKDSVRARAAIKALEDSGERGLERATSVMSSNIGTISKQENGDLRASLLSYTHSLGLKGRDNRLNKWADEGDDSVLSGGSHLQGLSFRELASQTNESLEQALDVNKNAISQEDAKQIMAGVANGTIDMKTGPKMELFRALAEGRPLPPRNNNTPPASTP